MEDVREVRVAARSRRNTQEPAMNQDQQKPEDQQAPAPQDLQPTADPKGGLLLPAVQKVREAAARGG
jgi:hypothetical protein